MLMEETRERYGQEQTNKSEDAIITIGNEPVMQSAIDVLSILGSKNQIILKARGNSIPNAVAVANIITEKMLKGNSKVQKINLDTVEAAGIGRMTSTI
ncbi:MAG: DNA-binding protein, partial [Nitrosopumilaceae archaeon]